MEVCSSTEMGAPGSVRVDMLFKANEPGRSSAGSVTFEPEARTAWHPEQRRRGRTRVIGKGLRGARNSEKCQTDCVEY